VSRRAELAPPGGMAPPASAQLPDGTMLDLGALAAEIADAHLERHPEDVERYGRELAHAWCTHDTQHLLAWAVGGFDVDGQVSWLANVLTSRGYPLANLIETLERCAQALDGVLATEAAQELRDAAAHVQSA